MNMNEAIERMIKLFDIVNSLSKSNNILYHETFKDVCKLIQRSEVDKYQQAIDLVRAAFSEYSR